MFETLIIATIILTPVAGSAVLADLIERISRK